MDFQVEMMSEAFERNTLKEVTKEYGEGPRGVVDNMSLKIIYSGNSK
jgi:hypothetical protein